MIKALLDTMCRGLQITSERWHHITPDLLMVFKSVFGGATGQVYRSGVNLGQIMQLSHHVNSPKTFVETLIHQCMLRFPMQLDGLLQLLAVLVGNEPASAAAVLQQFARLRYFCGPCTLEDQQVCMEPGCALPSDETPMITSHRFEGKWPGYGDSRRHFIVPAPRCGVDRSTAELVHIYTSKNHPIPHFPVFYRAFTV